MARFKGLFRFIGTLGDITAVNSKEGVYLKSKNNIPKSRYKNAPQYKDFRMNGHYMAESSKLSKEFRFALGLFGKEACDSRMYARMNGLMRSIIMCDTVSEKGVFSAVNGIATIEGKKLLQDFEFSKFKAFNSVFRGNYQLEKETGPLSIPEFLPHNDLLLADGATHVSLQTGILRFDFETRQGIFSKSDNTVFEISTLAVNVTLTADIPTGSHGTLIYFFKISFSQEINGVLNPLKGESGAVMKIVEAF